MDKFKYAKQTYIFNKCEIICRNETFLDNKNDIYATDCTLCITYVTFFNTEIHNYTIRTSVSVTLATLCFK